MNGLRVYVAGPISKGNVILNIRRAIEAAEKLRVAGHYPFVPHLTVAHWYFLFIDQHSLDNASWHDWNLAWLKVCEAIVRLPGESAGSEQEVAAAKHLGIAVYESVEDFLKYNDIRIIRSRQ